MFVAATASGGSREGVLLSLYYDRLGVSTGAVSVRYASVADRLQLGCPALTPFKVRSSIGRSAVYPFAYPALLHFRLRIFCAA